MATYAQRLANVQAAIDEILVSGVSMRWNNRQLTMANLNELRQLEQDYQKLAAIEASAAAGGGRARITLVTPV